jgi:hypothetical protein
MLAFTFLFFPLPAIFSINRLLRDYANKKFKKNPANGVVWFERKTSIMRLVAVLIWGGIIGLYLYTLQPILSIYILQNHHHFWQYYAVAAAFPSLWLLWRIVAALRRSFQYQNFIEKSIQEDESIPLIERIRGENY